MADVGARHYWFVPVRLFMKDKFRSDLRAGKVTAPVLVVHGEEDKQKYSLLATSTTSLFLLAAPDIACVTV